MKRILFLLLLSAGAFAHCAGSASHYLPAVVDDHGVLVNLSLDIFPGSGDIYMSIYPKVGISTQESIRDAMDYAFETAGQERNECDVRIKAYLPESVGGYLDGPSGGAALTIMGIAALQGEEVRSDAMITGTVMPDGTIGPVGGLYEKAKIAKEHGLRYFLTPLQTLYERVLLRMLQQDKRIIILEAADVGEAAAFLIDMESIDGTRKPPQVEKINESLPAYGARSEFRQLAEEMVSALGQSVARISDSVKEGEMLGEYYGQVDANERLLMERGYYFSAANDAFIHYLDAETIANVETLDVGGKVAEVRSCLAKTPVDSITSSNLEWVAGEELRKGWAEMKLEEVEAQNATLKEEKYLAYHDAMYADAWCEIAGMLWKNSPKGGDEFDESLLREVARDYLTEAKLLNSTDENVLWHLENAENLFYEGRYAGAIIDSVYVIEMENAALDYDDDEYAALAELETLGSERRTSLWGDVYASHGAFVLWKGDNQTAFGLFRFASGLDRAVERMKAAADGNKAAEFPYLCEYAAGLLVMAGATILAYLYLRPGTQQKPNVFKKAKRQ